MNNENKETYHKSVLVDEVLEYLNPQPGKLYIDATFGGGGHTRAILDHEPNCKVIALDWDTVAIEENAEPLKEKYGDRFRVLWGNFSHLYRILKKEKIHHIDGVLADFGTSQTQIFKKEGFSFRVDTPLDMRMSPAHQRVTAATIVNTYSEKKLLTILYEYGEEKFARKIVQAIIEQRKKKHFRKTLELAKLIEDVVPIQKQKGRRKIHPATKTFQALRIEVNNELSNIKSFLSAAHQLLNPHGRIVCISFHSLEDRLVKNFFREHQLDLKTITNKPIHGTDQEIEQNPSARSAKLRCAEKIAPGQ